MKSPMDALGNELSEGQQVIIHLPTASLLTGIVAKVNPGGVISPNGGNQRSPALVVIQVAFPIPCQPGQALQGIYRTVDPRSQAIVEEISGVGKPREGKPS